MSKLFGDPRTKQFTSDGDRRLKVNFYARNWIVFASVSVRAVVQKKRSAVLFKYWDKTSDFQELRVGWKPMEFDLNLPDFQIAGDPVPQDPFNVAGKMLAKSVNVRLGDADFLTFRTSDVLGDTNVFGVFPYAVQR